VTSYGPNSCPTTAVEIRGLANGCSLPEILADRQKYSRPTRRIKASFSHSKIALRLRAKISAADNCEPYELDPGRCTAAPLHGYCLVDERSCQFIRCGIPKIQLRDRQYPVEQPGRYQAAVTSPESRKLDRHRLRHRYRRVHATAIQVDPGDNAPLVSDADTTLVLV